MMSASRIVWILLLCCIAIHAAPWNSSCSNNDECDRTGTMMICRDGRCACNEPWFRACNRTCVVNRGISYQRDQCAVQENCINYTNCIDNRCECFQGYTPVNGVCLKKLNISCTFNLECWSGYCSKGRCECAPGFEPRSDLIRCRRRLVKVFDDWVSANASGELCFVQQSCIDFRATCVNDTFSRSRSYCKCPEGYEASEDNERCVSVENNQLSPLDETPAFYQPCGYCQDENAACMKAANQTTCWCRAGYGRVGSQCANNRRMNPPVIFPNRFDWSYHDYTDNCTGLYNNTNSVEAGLCTCAKDWTYVSHDRPCEKIEAEWIDNNYEYGLCTRINSLDQAFPEEGLCPTPLICEARQDKHVCSCGRNQFRDFDNTSSCVYYIGRPVFNNIGPCPRNARYNGTTGVCDCLPGYQPIDEDRRCQLILSQDVTDVLCNRNFNLDGTCRLLFGQRAFYCRLGECRCSGVESFPYDNATRCYAPVDQPLSSPRENCPPNSYPDPNTCQCCQGYEKSPNSRRCDLVSPQLNEYSPAAAPPNPNFFRAECRPPFLGPVEYLGSGVWQCDSESIISDDREGCWYKLNVLINRSPNTNYCPPRSAFVSERKCECNVGYEANDNICVRKVDFVYAENDTNVITKIGLREEDCLVLFGSGAKVSMTNDYCACRPNAYPINFNTYCRFYLNRYTLESKSQNTTCPDHSLVQYSSPNEACVCEPGYYASEDLTTCEFANVTLVGTLDTRPITNCFVFRDIDCQVKFGKNAFCVNDTCYCDRRKSFIGGEGQCEPFSNYIFPGIHERNYYTCDIDEDCGNPIAVKCDYLFYDLQYKVCQCRDGWLLDPKSRSCVDRRCQPECDLSRNFVCNGYNCVCRQGYYLNGTECIPITTRLKLDDICNQTDYTSYWLSYDRLTCDANCRHTRCLQGNKVKGFECVPMSLNREPCLFRSSVCKEIDQNAFCNAEENVCTCAPTFYQYGGACAKAIDSRCLRDTDCNGGEVCKGQRCQCNNRQQQRETLDIYGRSIVRCVNDAALRGMSLILSILLLFASILMI